MHELRPDAFGLFAAALLGGLVQKLISQGLLGKEDLVDLCAAAKRTFDAAGVKHNDQSQTDAGLIAAALVAEIESRF